jgi:hypothetical protein
VPNLEPHQITDDCADAHCFFHDVDEDPIGAHIVCFECGHVYRTAGQLRRDYRRGYWDTTGRGAKLFGEKGFGPSLAARLWRMLTVRAKDIFFCQECTHDF